MKCMYCGCHAPDALDGTIKRLKHSVAHDVDEMRNRITARFEAISSPSQKLPQQSAPELRESNANKAIEDLRGYLAAHYSALNLNSTSSQLVEIAICKMRDGSAALAAIGHVAAICSDVDV